MNIPYQLIADAPVDQNDAALAAWVAANARLLRFVVMEIRAAPPPGAPRRNGRPPINDNLFFAFLRDKISGEANAVSQRHAAKMMQGFSKISGAGAIRVMNRLQARGVLMIEKSPGDGLAPKKVWAVPEHP